ncbi:hypothetical protein HanIR_Chr09g0398121 [Helianthus annuus]|nr:hypothetical protein HanIR_Chr09g0398121 [Helianthus annuus]
MSNACFRYTMIMKPKMLSPRRKIWMTMKMFVMRVTQKARADRWSVKVGRKKRPALVKAWVHCSINIKKGNQQKSDNFWGKVLALYNTKVGSTRTIHQVRSKWTPMLTKSNHFNSLWHQADRIRCSGCNDVDVMKRALKDVEACEVVQKHEKWAKVPLLGEENDSSGQK